MGVNGKKAVCNEFNWETQEKALLDLYKSMETFNRRDGNTHTNISRVSQQKI